MNSSNFSCDPYILIGLELVNMNRNNNKKTGSTIRMSDFVSILKIERACNEAGIANCHFWLYVHKC